MRSLLTFSTFIVSLVVLVAAGNLEVKHKSAFSKRHTRGRVARELDSPTNRSLTNDVAVVGTRDLERRFEGVRFTYYDAGKGACGATNTNSDFIVALNAPQFGSGSYCFQMITIIVNGKTATAQITDECEGCPFAGLDFSRGLFDYFSSESAGVLTGSWYFGSTPATTTSTYIPPTTTQAPTPTTTTTTSSSSSYTTSSSPVSVYSSTSSAANASPSASSSNNTTSSSVYGVLEQFNSAFVNIGAIILAAKSGLD